MYRYVVVLIEAALPLLFVPEGGDPARCCASAGGPRDDDHARDTMEAAVHAAATLRNLGYANAPNRAAAAAAGALEALAEALRRATLDGGAQQAGGGGDEFGGSAVVNGQHRELAFVSANALVNLATNDHANKIRIATLGVAHIVKQLLNLDI
jgi:hypothetical protein